MRWVERAAQRLTGSRALFVLGILIILHLLTMLEFMHNSRMDRETMQRENLIQKIVNTIHLVQATPVIDRENAIKVTADPMIDDSITTEPVWPLQFRGVSWWEINSALRKQRGEFSVSIQLLPNQWLNIRAAIYSQFLLSQLSVLAIEFFAVGLIFLAAWTINRYTRPLETFKDAALAVSDQLSTFPSKIKGPAMVQEVVNAVRTMRERIAQHAKDRTKMLAAISHDLRTPITRMTLRAQLLPDEETRDALMRDLQEMEQMVNETLSFARADAASAAVGKLDLVSLLQSVCHTQVDMGHTVSFVCDQQRIPYNGKLLALKRAFTNLVSNACRYGDQVWVRCAIGDDQVLVEIKDNGPGLPESELEQVFQPFYRSDQSRSRDSGGFGLGLAVTRDLIAVHGGEVYLKRADPGLIAVVLLPLGKVVASC